MLNTDNEAFNQEFDEIKEQFYKVMQKNLSQGNPAKHMSKAKKYVMPVVQTAVAASVCLIAVFSIQNLNKGSETETTVSPALQTLPFTQSVQEVSYNVSHKNVPSKEQLEQQNKRLNEILQNYQLQRRLYSDLKAE